MGASVSYACSNCFNPSLSKEAQSLLSQGALPTSSEALPTPMKLPDKHPQEEPSTAPDITSADLIDLAEAAANKFAHLVANIDFSQYDLMTDKDGFRILSRDTAEGYSLWSEFNIPFTPEQFMKFLSKSEKRKDWDLNVAESRKLSQLSDTVSIIYQVYKSFLTISSRDLLTISKTYNEGETWIDASTSIDSCMVPANKHHVRAKLVLGGLVVKPLVGDPNGNLASVISYSDSIIGGSVPKSMVKKFSASAIPKFVKAVTVALKEDLAK